MSHESKSEDTLTPADDARAALRLAVQKIAKCRAALKRGDRTEARRELDYAKFSIADALAVLEPDLSLPMCDPAIGLDLVL